MDHVPSHLDHRLHGIHNILRDRKYMESDFTWMPGIQDAFPVTAHLKSVPGEVALVVGLPPLLRVEAGPVQDDAAALTLVDL